MFYKYIQEKNKCLPWLTNSWRTRGGSSKGNDASAYARDSS
jgi:hypothetical protein